jgi:hypothetical protein
MRLTSPALGLVLLTSALGLSSCGGSGDDEIAVAALGSQIAFQLPAPQAACTAQKIVETGRKPLAVRVGQLVGPGDERRVLRQADLAGVGQPTRSRS